MKANNLIPVREYRSVEKKNATTLRIPLGMHLVVVGSIPNGMQVLRRNTFSTERYSLTGIWSLLSYSVILNDIE